jgi:type I restriction enzyme S subunit
MAKRIIVMIDDDELNFDKDVKHISDEDFQRLSRKIKPEFNDIIYSRISARLGKARMVKTNKKFLVSYSCCIIRVNQEKILSEYCCKILDTDLVLTDANLRTQSIGVSDLGLNEIERFSIPVLPIIEQKLILKFLEQRLSKV